MKAIVREGKEGKEREARGREERRASRVPRDRQSPLPPLWLHLLVMQRLERLSRREGEAGGLTATSSMTIGISSSAPASVVTRVQSAGGVQGTAAAVSRTQTRRKERTNERTLASSGKR